MIIEHLEKHYGDNSIYKDLSFILEKGERLAITGRNGAGKSTLLRILAGQDKDYRGSVRDGSGVLKGYFAQDTENTLNNSYTVLEEVESIADTKDIPHLRSMLGSFLFQNDDVFKKVSVLSGGEKSRLALLKILLHPSNLLLLDEPTNHLDINAKDMLLDAIKNYEGTLVFVSHDKHFIKNLATKILYVSEDGPEFFNGDYSYFEYKLEEKEALYAVKKAEEKREEKPIEKKNSYEEMKARRNRLNGLQREVEKLDKQLSELSSELDAINKEIEKPEVYSDAEKIKKALKNKEDVEKRIEAAESLWLSKSEELENIRG